MDVKDFINSIGADFFAGVPDSQLSALCDCLYDSFGVSGRHIVAANEGNAVALAAGHFLATGRPGLVYMQNSGIGNAVNPICSLLNEKVYGIPVIFVVGWRGEPGIHDEPQHVFQGEITLDLLKVLGIEYRVIDRETTPEDVKDFVESSKELLGRGRSIAFVVRKGALTYANKPDYSNGRALSRERAIELISGAFEGDVIVSTTGKASRELFEIRERRGESHGTDFLTVGSMGHSSSIALAIALEKPDAKVVCIDGDGAVIMHMGALAVEGRKAPENLIHFVINNGAHDSVGGMPTPAAGLKLSEIAGSCGYGKENVFSASNEEELVEVLKTVQAKKGPAFVEVFTSTGARKDLGRPTVPARKNAEHFIEFLGQK